MELLVIKAFSFQTIDGWIQAGGYTVLFGLLFACGVGLPLPEDIPLMVAGALIAKDQMELGPVAIAAWCGIIGGDLMLYYFGKKFGLEITRVRFIGKHLTAARIERVEQMFAQYGIFVVGFGRMFAGVRGAMVVAAGVTRYNFWKFIVTDGIAAVISGGFFIFVGYLLGNHLTADNVKEFKHVFIAGACIVAAGVLGWNLWRKSRAVERVETVALKAERVAEAAHLKPQARVPSDKI